MPNEENIQQKGNEFRRYLNDMVQWTDQARVEKKFTLWNDLLCCMANDTIGSFSPTEVERVDKMLKGLRDAQEAHEVNFAEARKKNKHGLFRYHSPYPRLLDELDRELKRLLLLNGLLVTLDRSESPTEVSHYIPPSGIVEETDGQGLSPVC